MKNHDEKAKDMAESVLPSTSRKQAREERRLIHKRQRARERDQLAGIPSAVDAAECDPDFREGRRKRDTRDLVLDRRAADKVAPLTRWAGRRVDRDERLRSAPLDEQVEHFTGLMPDNLVGRHAVQHIEWALEFRSTGDHSATIRAERDLDQEHDRARARSDVHRILAAGLHKELNAALRAGYRDRATTATDGTWAFPPPARLLFGLHDVDDFAHTVAHYDWIRNLVGHIAELGQGRPTA